MSQTTTGIRNFKAQLSSYVQQAKAGSVVIITERGKPVARLMPIRPTIEQRMEELVEAGLLDWNGQTLEPWVPEVKARGERTVAELLLEDRE
ncbi:MAG: type II toxin-antitoxin system prevent-host-death family antitoxin [Anaerolineae bacterium]|nr:type II toxin-antitoxin system prevent-host-death family antitoxin [Anaerolineae bacterium]MCB9142498.1 type II toxin-antitoxin system prevent-host-death family antitoxin [Anaerolineales bacterium]MCB0232483.1 type II toxin-antitoxin system prevent-host-death family antitoxin [Anaerolineae bacterium]MCB0236883.1 type II toxin-antitoxin system prevent-host-death family antitoxin [Anaerolineae bacterium]MCB0246769.1 type II toxin-antitoxin system prevent-host-death family antitoxin [Anaeroline